MKHTHLSNFQKQQYTTYLECHLQKFSAFMLSQRKQNEKYKALEQAVVSHSNLIEQLQQKNQMNEFYLHQNASNLEHLAKRCEKIDYLEGRVKRLQDRERFDCDREARKHYDNNKKENKTERQFEQREKILEVNLNELTKKLKKIEEEISKNKDSYLPKFGTNDSSMIITAIEENNEKKMKKMEKKMKKYFACRFQQIQSLVKLSKKNRSKSPIARTPIQLSTMSHCEVDLISKPLSQFKLQDHSINKSEVSTVLRQSNTAVSSRNRSKMAESKVEKQKGKNNKKDESRSKSKSKNKKKDEVKKFKKNRSGSVSKSKSRKLDRSVSYSENSFVGSSTSSISRSKSKISKNQSLDLKKKKTNKQPKTKAHRVSKSKSKSDRSEISMHQRCKRRPEYERTQLNQRSQKQKLKRQKSIKKHYNK